MLPSEVPARREAPGGGAGSEGVTALRPELRARVARRGTVGGDREGDDLARECRLAEHLPAQVLPRQHLEVAVAAAAVGDRARAAVGAADHAGHQRVDAAARDGDAGAEDEGVRVEDAHLAGRRAGDDVVVPAVHLRAVVVAREPRGRHLHRRPAQLVLHRPRVVLEQLLDDLRVRAGVQLVARVLLRALQLAPPLQERELRLLPGQNLELARLRLPHAELAAALVVAAGEEGLVGGEGELDDAVLRERVPVVQVDQRVHRLPRLEVPHDHLRLRVGHAHRRDLARREVVARRRDRQRGDLLLVAAQKLLLVRVEDVRDHDEPADEAHDRLGLGRVELHRRRVLPGVPDHVLELERVLVRHGRGG